MVLAASGYCVALANADVANGISATITFAAGLNGQTITLHNGPLELTDATASTTITGAGQGITISGFNFVTLQGNTTNGSNLVSGLSSTTDDSLPVGGVRQSCTSPSTRRTLTLPSRCPRA